MASLAPDMGFDKIKSFAKINLALNIISKSTKLHRIESLVSFIDLHDKILIKKIKSNKHCIIFKGKFSKKIKKENTVLKLLKILDQKKLINHKFLIQIDKRIPQKSGLGGGSMNAANILKYFIKKKIINTNKKQIIEISNLVGSDVILGLESTHSVLTSKNKIKRFKNCPRLYTLIVMPKIGCSSKYIYSKVKKFDKIKFAIPKKKMFNPEFLKEMSNSLEPIALSKYPDLKKIKNYLINLRSPIFVRMTGSGSAFVSYYFSKNRCDKAHEEFIRDNKKYWSISSKTI